MSSAGSKVTGTGAAVTVTVAPGPAVTSSR